MTAITRNLPWFVKDLGVSIVGQKCYTSVVEDLNFADVECLKYCLSKGLGLGIVVGGSVMKVPQLLLIVSARSARGLSTPAYILETLSYAITLAYSYRNGFPFSTYGETFFLTLQNAVITLLIIHYTPLSSRLTRARQSSNVSRVALAAFLSVVTSVALYLIPKSTLALLQLSTLPLSLFSKFPQIRQNYRAQSTGQLSAIAVIAQVAGCLARLFTTATEVGDIIVSASFALALALNIVIGAQMWMYWGKDEKVEPTIGVEMDEKKPVVREWQPTPNESFVVLTPPRSPTPSSQGKSSGRKWARKVD